MIRQQLQDAQTRLHRARNVEAVPAGAVAPAPVIMPRSVAVEREQPRREPPREREIGVKFRLPSPEIQTKSQFLLRSPEIDVGSFADWDNKREQSSPIHVAIATLAPPAFVLAKKEPPQPIEVAEEPPLSVPAVPAPAPVALPAAPRQEGGVSQCARGHSLEPCTDAAEGRWCEPCFVKRGEWFFISPQGKFYTCIACGYDVCQECWSMSPGS